MTKPRLFHWIAGNALSSRRLALILLLTASLIMIAGFSTSSQEDDARGARVESDAAIVQFWNVYHGNQYSQIPQVQQQLQNALDRDPGNSTLYALLGATHFWHIGEYTRDPNPDPAVLQQDLPDAVDLFGKGGASASGQATGQPAAGRSRESGAIFHGLMFPALG